MELGASSTFPRLPNAYGPQTKSYVRIEHRVESARVYVTVARGNG
jgi:hypothetical protein